MALVEAIGVVSGVLGIFSFFQDQFKDAGSQGIGYNFKVGLDGANGDLSNAGGNIPDIRAFNEHGEELGIKVNDHNKCDSGADDCFSQVDNVHQQPTYTLFTGNDDAICLAWISVTFPGKDKYAWLGNWAQQCDAPWYYSDIYVKNDQGADKVMCAWVDADGDISTTGIQVHWPEYSKGFAGNGNDPSYYCNNQPPLDFRTEPDPNTVVFWTRKRNLFAENPSVAMSPAVPDKKQKRADYLQRIKRSQANDNRLVKSKSKHHVATDLCKSETSVGPSFVAYDERKFCHMADKKLYSFCDDVKSGHCWNDHTNAIETKGNVTSIMAAAPRVKFGKTLQWGESDS